MIPLEVFETLLPGDIVKFNRQAVGSDRTFVIEARIESSSPEAYGTKVAYQLLDAGQMYEWKAFDLVSLIERPIPPIVPRQPRINLIDYD